MDFPHDPRDLISASPCTMQTTLGKGDDPASSSFSRQLGVLAPISNATGESHSHSLLSIFMSTTRSLTQLTRRVGLFLSFCLSFNPAPRARQLLNHNGASSCSGPSEFSGLGNIEEMPTSRLRHKNKTDMKHCRHAISVHSVHRVPCATWGMQRLASGATCANKFPLNSAHNFSIILWKFSFSPAPMERSLRKGYARLNFIFLFGFPGTSNNLPLSN